MFTRHKSFGNLARMDPAMLTVTTPKSRHITLAGGGSNPMVFVSLVIVRECHLDEYRSKLGRASKVLVGIPLRGWFERLVCCIGSVYGEEEFGAQIYKEAIDFTTMTTTGEIDLMSVVKSYLTYSITEAGLSTPAPSKGTSNSLVSPSKGSTTTSNLNKKCTDISKYFL